MIVPMSHLTVLCTESSRREVLDELQSLGVLHVTHESAPTATEDLAAAEKALADAERALGIVKGLPSRGDAGGPAPATATPEAVLDATSRIDALHAEIDALDRDIARYLPFGDFDPDEARAIQSSGLDVTLFKAPQESRPEAAGGYVRILSESRSEKAVYGVAVGGLADGVSCERIPLPSRRLSLLEADRAARVGELQEAREALGRFAGAGKALAAEVAKRRTYRDFCAADAGMGTSGGIAWITGFCPDDALGKISETARRNGWGFAARPPAEDELPPTLLRPPRLFRAIASLFSMLDISPGYREVDVSVVFYAFFTVFFAMLVGDAGYGALMLAATLFFRRKFPRAAPAPFILLTVFSAATCVWGVLSCNYFGAHPEALDFASARWLNDPSYANIMQLCFLLGALHLTVARLWSAAQLCPSAKALAELGWTGIVWTMYCAACAVVIEGFAFPGFMKVVAPLSILLVFLFTLSREEIKTQGVTLAILPLNIISCLGDIISYVRLFAVGLASVKVAENFNTMALDMSLPLVVKIPVVVLILLLGHGLNLAMGALSILVHAVRLNTLEFSSHKGISWMGFAYAPFRK